MFSQSWYHMNKREQALIQFATLCVPRSPPGPWGKRRQRCLGLAFWQKLRYYNYILGYPFTLVMFWQHSGFVFHLFLLQSHIFTFTKGLSPLKITWFSIVGVTFPLSRRVFFFLRKTYNENKYIKLCSSVKDYYFFFKCSKYFFNAILVLNVYHPLENNNKIALVKCAKHKPLV